MALVPSRTATAAVLAASTFIPALNEVILASDTGITKIGDGVRTWATLPVADNKALSLDRLVGLSDATGTGAEVYAVGATMTSLTLVTPIFTSTNNITASATQTQVGATALITNLNRVTVVVTPGDAVRLPVSYAGRLVRIKNTSATNAISVFPSTGDAINALAANASFSIPAAKTCEFFCMAISFWDTLLSA